MDLTPWEEPSFYDQLDNTGVNKSERKFNQTHTNFQTQQSNQLVSEAQIQPAAIPYMNRTTYNGFGGGLNSYKFDYSPQG